MKSALVIDDHPIARLGCRQLLSERGYDPVFEALHDNDALRLSDAHKPDLIVLDLGMPGLGGLGLIAPLLLRAPDTRILIFSMNEQTVFVSKALEAGATGYLSKNSGPEDFCDAISALEADRLYLSHDMALAVAASRIGGKADPLSSLTEREHQVLRLIGQGEDLQSVANALRISYKTAANTSSSIKKKLGLSRTTELIRYAIEAKLTS
ncbi:response regulator transcription factor [Puniceibacterium sp. IMCC21224]|uniref:response regulator n=1 Tax=Puniceibacterium sp. IMCC21224 TaxID=1618204 RepID=UPI00064DD587|nr:response regulator transcription factor [Puniceibacterium sp. IMCC21224]KMK65537.1 response regulator containing a CheY-like receiver domain and an HTH DNA-binding domain [Puniceibacterium sp. IMCC21224]